MAKQEFDADAVRQFLKENMPYDDIRPSRYDKLVERAAVVPVMDAIASALDETFGMNVSDAHATHDELYVLSEALIATLIDHEVYKRIRSRIKRKEDF